MRKLFLVLLLTGGAAYGQQTFCNINNLNVYSNLKNQCINWTFSFYSTGASAEPLFVVQINGAPDSNGSPGPFTALGCTPVAGTNPMNFDPGALHQEISGVIVFTNCYSPWIQVTYTSLAGILTVRGYGAAGITSAKTGGSGPGGGVTGSGNIAQCAYWTGTTSINGNSSCSFDGIGNLGVSSSLMAGLGPTITGSGIVGITENTGQACAAGADCIVADLATHRALLLNNNVSMGAVLGASSNDTLTGKTFDTGGSGNVLKLSGLQISTAQGTTAKVQMAGAGGATAGHCTQYDVGGNIVDSGGPCGSSGSGFPVYQSGAASATTSSTSEVNLATSPSIAAGTLTANGSITVFMTYRFVGTAGAKTPIVRLSTVSGQVGGGTGTTSTPIYNAPTSTTALSFNTVATVTNANATNSQVGASSGFGGSNNAVAFANIDTAANATFVNFGCLVANPADFCQLVHYKIFVNP